MSTDEMKKLRSRISQLNLELLELLNKRAELVLDLAKVKQKHHREMFDPMREAGQLEELENANPGPFSNATIKRLFTEIFRASLDLQRGERDQALRVTRAFRSEDTVFQVGETIIGRQPLIIAGPCAVESEQLVEDVARELAARGVKIMRGGAHKPRTSPYSFQGLGDLGYRLLGEAAHRHGMLCVSEVMDEKGIKAAAEHIDILQIGARNMANFRLLEVVREAGKPVLLKRGMQATYEELLLAAEYLIAGTDRIILCERGIRTFETWTRNTLDISAVPIMRSMSHLPICVDVSHAAGRTDILAPLARAALAAGAQSVMLEVHPAPAFALSDAEQQIDYKQLDVLLEKISDLLPAK